MDRIPRFTAYFQKNAKLRRQDIQDMLQDPEIRDAWDCTIAAFRRTIAHGEGQPFPLTDAQSEALWAQSAADRAMYTACFNRLVTLIPQRAPQVARVWGRFVPEQVGIGVFRALGLEPPSDWGQRAEHLSPDNPIRRVADKIYEIPDHADHKYLLELTSYRQALKPANPRGRPPKKPNVKPHGRQNRIDPVLAAQAYQMSSERRMKWKDIARALSIPLTPHDHQQHQRVYRYIKRLIERGRIHALSP